MTDERRPPLDLAEAPPDEELRAEPPPGQGPIVLVGLAIGILLMGIQLWLLTTALELYLAGSGGQVWQLALISGLIFLGGYLMLRLLRRRPRSRRISAGALDYGAGFDGATGSTRGDERERYADEIR